MKQFSSEQHLNSLEGLSQEINENGEKMQKKHP